NKDQWNDFKADWRKWSLLHEAAGDDERKLFAADLADNPDEYELINKNIETFRKEYKEGKRKFQIGDKMKAVSLKPGGQMRTWHWSENRGRIAFLIVTGRVGSVDAEGKIRYVPWEPHHFWEWFSTEQVPVLLEPLVKLLRPVVYLLQSGAGFWNRIYFTLVLIWTLATWALFGGAITRLAAVEVARREKIGWSE